MRVTVKIKERGDADWRDFHLAEARAQRFADRVVREGGEAKIVPLAMSDNLCSMLRGCGVDPSKIK